MPTAPQIREAMREWALINIRLKCRAQNPRRELFVADSGQLAAGRFPAGDGDDFFEDTEADLLDSFGAVENGAGIDVHVILHPIEERRVRGDLDARRGFAAVNTAAAGGEDADVAAAADEAGHADRIVSRGVHERESGGGDGFGVLINSRQRRLA